MRFVGMIELNAASANNYLARYLDIWVEYCVQVPEKVLRF